jgi:uncharacterized protein DUF4062
LLEPGTVTDGRVTGVVMYSTKSDRHRLFGVFISSTRTDLTAERELLVRRLLTGPYAPVAAESFAAGPEPSWRVIERKLAAADYYIVIVGGKYGSIDRTDEDGRSFTEREYDYARARMPVMAFLTREFETLPEDKCEAEPERFERVARFRDRLRSEQLLYEWSDPGELVYAVQASLTDAIVHHPRPGWIRGDSIPEDLSAAWEKLVTPSAVLGIERISTTGLPPADLLAAKLRSGNTIRIITTSGVRLFENHRRDILTAVSRGAVIRVLLPIPGSDFVKDVDDVESVYADRGTKIDQEIQDARLRLADIVAEAKESSVSDGAVRPFDVQVAHFSTHLRSTYTICDDSWAWLTITLPPERAVQSPSLELVGSGDAPLISLCIQNFDRAWRTAVLREDVTRIGVDGEVR